MCAVKFGSVVLSTNILECCVSLKKFRYLLTSVPSVKLSKSTTKGLSRWCEAGCCVSLCTETPKHQIARPPFCRYVGSYCNVMRSSKGIGRSDTVCYNSAMYNAPSSS